MGEGSIDPKASIANLLAELPSDRIGDMLRRRSTSFIPVSGTKGWPHVAAKQYAVKFGYEVLEAIRASTFSTGRRAAAVILHRLVQCTLIRGRICFWERSFRP
jgi:hypothetical protein